MNLDRIIKLSGITHAPVTLVESLLELDKILIEAKVLSNDEVEDIFKKAIDLANSEDINKSLVGKMFGSDKVSKDVKEKYTDIKSIVGKYDYKINPDISKFNDLSTTFDNEVIKVVDKWKGLAEKYPWLENKVVGVLEELLKLKDNESISNIVRYVDSLIFNKKFEEDTIKYLFSLDHKSFNAAIGDIIQKHLTLTLSSFAKKYYMLVKNLHTRADILIKEPKPTRDNIWSVFIHQNPKAKRGQSTFREAAYYAATVLGRNSFFRWNGCIYTTNISKKTSEVFLDVDTILGNAGHYKLNELFRLKCYRNNNLDLGSKKESEFETIHLEENLIPVSVENFISQLNEDWQKEMYIYISEGLWDNAKKWAKTTKEKTMSHEKISYDDIDRAWRNEDFPKKPDDLKVFLYKFLLQKLGHDKKPEAKQIVDTLIPDHKIDQYSKTDDSSYDEDGKKEQEKAKAEQEENNNKAFAEIKQAADVIDIRDLSAAANELKDLNSKNKSVQKLVAHKHQIFDILRSVMDNM